MVDHQEAFSQGPIGPSWLPPGTGGDRTILTVATKSLHGILVYFGIPRKNWMILIPDILAFDYFFLFFIDKKKSMYTWRLIPQIVSGLVHPGYFNGISGGDVHL